MSTNARSHLNFDAPRRAIATEQGGGKFRDATNHGGRAARNDAGELLQHPVECYCEEEGVVVLGVDVDEPADAAGVEEGADDVVDAAAAGAGSFFSSVFAAPVSLPAPDGGLSLSE